MYEWPGFLTPISTIFEQLVDNHCNHDGDYQIWEGGYDICVIGNGDYELRIIGAEEGNEDHCLRAEDFKTLIHEGVNLVPEDPTLLIAWSDPPITKSHKWSDSSDALY